MSGKFVMTKNQRYERDINTTVQIDYVGGWPDPKGEFHELNSYKCSLY